jgi:hypothetical protein
MCDSKKDKQPSKSYKQSEQPLLIEPVKKKEPPQSFVVSGTLLDDGFCVCPYDIDTPPNVLEKAKKFRESIQEKDWPRNKNFLSHKGYKTIVEMLLQDNRVDPSANNNEAIQYASRYGHREVVEILLKDSRVNPSDKDNFTKKSFRHFSRTTV